MPLVWNHLEMRWISLIEQQPPAQGGQEPITLETFPKGLSRTPTTRSGIWWLGTYCGGGWSHLPADVSGGGREAPRSLPPQMCSLSTTQLPPASLNFPAVRSSVLVSVQGSVCETISHVQRDRITESQNHQGWRRPLKIIESNRQPNPTMPAQPCPQGPRPHSV